MGWKIGASTGAIVGLLFIVLSNINQYSFTFVCTKLNTSCPSGLTYVTYFMWSSLMGALIGLTYGNIAKSNWFRGRSPTMRGGLAFSMIYALIWIVFLVSGILFEGVGLPLMVIPTLPALVWVFPFFMNPQENILLNSVLSLLASGLLGLLCGWIYGKIKTGATINAAPSV